MYKFENLKVYKKALIFVDEIFNVTKGFPSDLKFSLNSQIVRAAISITANIAEGSGRVGSRESANFYNISKASLYETVSLLDIALMRDIISKEKYNELYNLSEEISKMLTGLIKYNGK